MEEKNDHKIKIVERQDPYEFDLKKLSPQAPYSDKTLGTQPLHEMQLEEFYANTSDNIHEKLMMVDTTKKAVDALKAEGIAFYAEEKVSSGYMQLNDGYKGRLDHTVVFLKSDFQKVINHVNDERWQELRGGENLRTLDQQIELNKSQAEAKIEQVKEKNLMIKNAVSNTDQKMLGNHSFNELLADGKEELDIVWLDDLALKEMQKSNIPFFAEKGNEVVKDMIQDAYYSKASDDVPYIAAFPKKHLEEVNNVLNKSLFLPLLKHLDNSKYSDHAIHNILSEYMFMYKDEANHYYKNANSRTNIQIDSEKGFIKKGKLWSKDLDTFQEIQESEKLLRVAKGRVISMVSGLGREM